MKLIINIQTFLKLKKKKQKTTGLDKIPFKLVKLTANIISLTSVTF